MMAPLRSAPLLALPLLIACPGGGTGGTDDCADAPEHEAFEAVACEPEVFPCPPTVELATAPTGPDDFEPIAEGSEQSVWYGSQGGYHFFTAAEMTGLCPIVFLDFKIEVEREDGSREVIQELERHVQSVRCALQPDLFPGVDCAQEDASLQRWWPMQLVIPCEYHPDNPDQETECVDDPVEHIENLDVILSVEVRDHNGDDDPSLARTARDEKRIDPACCN